MSTAPALDEEIERRKREGEPLGHMPCHREMVEMHARLRRLARRYLRLRAEFMALKEGK